MKLLHLYHDIMNLYGDYANVLAMQRILEKSGQEVSVDRISLGGNAVLSDYDFIFIGSGTEKNQKTVLADFMKYKEQLKAYIRSDKPLLMTGNSFEMLGRTITDGSGSVFEGLGLYEFYVTELHAKRITADIIAKADFLTKPAVGFINKSSEITGIKSPMFRIEFGVGNNAAEQTEGICDRNFYGTHITGPILEKNPHFLIYLARLILDKKPFDDHLEYEKKGYRITLEKLKERM